MKAFGLPSFPSLLQPPKVDILQWIHREALRGHELRNGRRLLNTAYADCSGSLNRVLGSNDSINLSLQRWDAGVQCYPCQYIRTFNISKATQTTALTSLLCWSRASLLQWYVNEKGSIHIHMLWWLHNHRNLSIARWSNISDIAFWEKCRRFGKRFQAKGLSLAHSPWCIVYTVQ